MSAKKYLALVTGHVKEIIATIVSSGIANEGDLIALNSVGHLDNSVMPVRSIIASEDLAAGDFVNIFDDTGTIKVRKADATLFSKKADGFVLNIVTSGNAALVYKNNLNNSLSGLTLGSDLYLSDSVSGGVTTTPPTGTAKIVQLIAKAVSTTEAEVNIHLAVELA
jgi:hypothetical protein